MRSEGRELDSALLCVRESLCWCITSRWGRGLGRCVDQDAVRCYNPERGFSYTDPACPKLTFEEAIAHCESFEGLPAGHYTYGTKGWRLPRDPSEVEGSGHFLIKIDPSREKEPNNNLSQASTHCRGLELR